MCSHGHTPAPNAPFSGSGDGSEWTADDQDAQGCALIVSFARLSSTATIAALHDVSHYRLVRQI
jgi:hypothetical protein